MAENKPNKELSEYDKYRILRSNSKNVRLDFYHNRVKFYPEKKTINIVVDSWERDDYIDELIEADEREQAKKLGSSYKAYESAEEEIDYEKDNLKECQEYFEKFKSKYNFRASGLAGPFADDTGKLKNAMINIMSGSNVTLNYGEGILDFVYADFLTPIKEGYTIFKLFEQWGKENTARKNSDKKQENDLNALSDDEHVLRTYCDFSFTFPLIHSISYASLYSAIFPPLIKSSTETSKSIARYGNYLLALQKEFLELIEFCFDEDFYPEVLGGLYPSERLHLYRHIHDMPTSFKRQEEFKTSHNIIDGDKMPYGATSDEIIKALTSMNMTPNDKQKEFAEKYGIKVNTLLFTLQHHIFISARYVCSSIKDMLELELTKMLEQNVRFRKCKRCGKYFIMKGNYDTHYCDRIAEGETRTCQQLAALDNYRAKIADNKAIPIYNKYYKRYAARVRAHQLKENDFNKWRYQAMTKRDECNDGKITPEEYIEWMEAYFPNRRRKN